MRGSSGAKITVVSDGVLKLGDWRVVRQGMWLIAHQAPVLPRVVSVDVDGYKMETLHEPITWALDHTEVMLGMLRELESGVWAQPALTTVDVEAVRARTRRLVDFGYQHDKLRRHTVRGLLLRAFDRVRWQDLRTCLTHGDATFDNVMFRGEQLVMIDPIPTTTTVAVPDLWSSDIGHILRSTLGFEHVRYNDDTRRFRVLPRQLRFLVVDDNEWLAASFWAVFHLLRTFRYQRDDEATRRMSELTYDAATRLL